MDRDRRAEIFAICVLGGGVAVFVAVPPAGAEWDPLRAGLTILGILAILAGIAVLIPSAWADRVRPHPASAAVPPSTPPPAVADGPAIRVSGWVVRDGDLSTLSLTDQALEDAAARAVLKARDLLAPDAAIEFRDLILLPVASVRFRAFSRMAGRYCHVMVSDRFEWTSKPKRGSGVWGFTDGDPAEPLPKWDDPAPLPWRSDQGWRDLLDQVGYQTRPLTSGTATMNYFTEWEIVVARESDDDWNAPSPDHYRLRGGRAEIVPMTDDDASVAGVTDDAE